jgi:hypothetical protein
LRGWCSFLSHDQRLSRKSGLFSCWLNLRFRRINWRQRLCLYYNWLHHWIGWMSSICFGVWSLFWDRRKRRSVLDRCIKSLRLLNWGSFPGWCNNSGRILCLNRGFLCFWLSDRSLFCALRWGHRI